jgi:hypothetical protein
MIKERSRHSTNDTPLGLDDSNAFRKQYDGNESAEAGDVLKHDIEELTFGPTDGEG